MALQVRKITSVDIYTLLVSLLIYDGPLMDSGIIELPIDTVLLGGMPHRVSESGPTGFNSTTQQAKADPAPKTN